jgi:hypothetical protein
MQPLHAQMVNELLLGRHHVADGNHGETQPVGSARGRIDGSRTGRAHAAAQDVRTDHEIAVRIDALVRAHHEIPPPRLVVVVRVGSGDMGVPGECVQDQDRIVAGAVQAAVSFIGDGHRTEAGAAFQHHRRRRLREGKAFFLHTAHRCALLIVLNVFTHVRYRAART